MEVSMGASPVGEPDTGARLRDLEAMLDAVAGHVIIKLDPAGRVVTWNRGAEAVVGYRAEEVLGQSVSMFYTDEDRAADVVARELQTARETGRFEFEGWRVRKGGERYWASVVLTPIRDEAGQLTGFAKISRDVGERGRADTMFRGLLEAAPDAIVIVGPDGRIVLANRQTDLLFGYDREDLIGREVEILVPPRFRQRHPDYRTRYFSDTRVRPMGVGLELFGLRRDGTEFPVEISLSPLETEQGSLVSAAIRDVTERREQELRLMRQRDEIMELSTPVIQVWDKVLALPIIGTLDSGRAARLTEGLLESIAKNQAEVVILDISGVPTIDTMVAQHLLKTVQAATLMGAVSIMSGVRPETAQAIVHLGINLGQLRSRNTLRDALQLALQVLRSRAETTTAAAATLTGQGLG
jgi:PAS domain S-box-containing protein